MTILTISPIFWQFLQFFFGNFDDFLQCWQLFTMLTNFDNSVVWALNLGPNPTQPKSDVKHFAIDIYLCHEFCLHFVPDRVPPCETWPILTTFALSRLDQMLLDCKKKSPTLHIYEVTKNWQAFLWAFYVEPHIFPPSYRTNSVRKKDFCLLRGPEGGGNPI